MVTVLIMTTLTTAGIVIFSLSLNNCYPGWHAYLLSGNPNNHVGSNLSLEFTIGDTEYHKKIL